MANNQIVIDKSYNTLYVRKTLVIPRVRTNILPDHQEGSLVYFDKLDTLCIKTKLGWRTISMRIQTVPSAPPLEKSSFHTKLTKDCLELDFENITDEDVLLEKFQHVFDDYKGKKIKRIQIKNAKDKMSKNLQKIIGRMVKKMKIENNGSAELEL